MLAQGDTYDNKEKALKSGTMKERTLRFTQAIDQGQPAEYNEIVMPGSGELSEHKAVTATIFSIHNMSRRNVAKKIMELADVHDMCDHFGVDRDDTLVVLYKRGAYDAKRSLEKKNHNKLPEVTSAISNEAQFSVQDGDNPIDDQTN